MKLKDNKNEPGNEITEKVLSTDATAAIEMTCHGLVDRHGRFWGDGNKDLIEKLNNRIQELEMVIKNSLEELDRGREYGFTIARRNLFRVLDEKK